MNENLLLLLSVVLALVLVAALAVTLYFAARGARDARRPPSPLARWRHDSLRQSFRRATRLIEANIASRGERYRVPWVLVLNESARDRSLPLPAAGIAAVLSESTAAPSAVQGVDWQFFGSGVVIDLRAAFLGLSDGTVDAEKPWEEFLGLCHRYRPQRPFDALVITLPAPLLLDPSAESRLELTQRAARAHRRLWLAQNRFAMRFATYVVVTDCERVAGFQAFSRNVPEDMRGGMLGWSSPFDPSINYQSEWVGAALAAILQTVSDTNAERFALGTGGEDAAALLTLPARLDAMREQMQFFVDELMRPSGYHEPFLLRGIYLTGDNAESFHLPLSDEGPGLDSRSGFPAADRTAHRDREPDEDIPAVPGDGEPAFFDIPVRAAASDEELLGSAPTPRPVFLRDLFERKIFLEYGLTQPSRTQRLRRPLVRSTVRGATVVLLGGWAVALVFATRQNAERSREWAQALTQLAHDELTQRTAAKQGRRMDPAWHRAKLVDLLRMNATLGPSWVTTVSMPGSWEVFDRLESRLRERLQRVFESIAAPALHRELMARVARLTGGDTEPGTGDILPGGECKSPMPPREATGANAGLAIAAQPEMLALQAYVAELDQLEQAFSALRRLQDRVSATVDDLHFLIGYAFDVDLHNDLSESLAFFHGRANGADLVAGVDTPAVRQSLRCAFNRGEKHLAERLFKNNPLYEAERRLAGGLQALRMGDAASVTDVYRTIFDAIETERHLVSTNAGAWMLPDGPGFGPAYERLLARVARNPLLGQAAADRLRNDMDFALQAARSAFFEHFAGQGGAMAWDEKADTFVLSTARTALRDLLAQLLDPTLLAPRKVRTVPAPARGEVLVWNAGQLDHALALRDIRKRFLDGALAQIPPGAGDALETGVDAQFSALIEDRTMAAAGMGVPAANADPAAFLAAGARLNQIAAALDEWNGREQASALRRRVSADAIEHLRAVDAALARSDLYGVADTPTPSARGGEPLLTRALGIRDPAAVNVYVQRQAARVQALGQRAAVFLPFVSPEDADMPVVRRWAAIDADLTRYKLSSPNSTLFALEQFVVSLGPAQAGERCIEKLAASPPAVGDDYFAGIHRRLHRQLAASCKALHGVAAKQAWQSFAAMFDRDLAGQSPFARPNAAPRGPTDRGPTDRGPTDRGPTDRGPTDRGPTDRGPTDRGPTDYRVVGEALRQFEALSRALGVRPDGSLPATGGGRDVDRFVTQFAGVARLLAPLYPDSDDVSAGYDVNVDFRVNRRAEIGGNQIIGWSLRSGSQTVESGATPRAVRWQPGMPVVLALRLAKDAPQTAAGDAGRKHYATDGRMVSFRFSDPWALLTFIAAHRVPQADAAGGQRTILLKFDFPLASPSANGAPREDAFARVFIRVSLSPAGKKSLLRWPGPFPSAAVPWKNERVVR
ncbi:type VI secretion system protein [Robbsia sp. Bb-Pol-6]|uniref:Type VI secretion system protein n=1 Tax=Robbsia betulipollinis TaxID=2981849 RepID=A0ABT3ZPB3_9BURK|nr:type VI secretion system protein [Robbsia betulipollinis]MCY0388388.1 type VI secretion system protein [Robbsia betulipollinis]